MIIHAICNRLFALCIPVWAFFTLLLGLPVGLTNAADSPRGTLCPKNRGQVSGTVRKPPYPSYKKSYALVIGVHEYTYWEDLPGVPKDIRAVREALECNGFHVDTLENPTHDEMHWKIRNFMFDNGGSNHQSENRLLIYYAGHGYSERNGTRFVGFLVPKDAPHPMQANQRKNLMFKTISFLDIVAKAKLIRSKHAIFVFDSCFSGAVFEQDGFENPQPKRRNLNKPALQFLTAGKAFQKVPDDGLFRKTFVEAITSNVADSNRDGRLTGSELGRYVNVTIREKTNDKTYPLFSSYQSSDLHPPPGEFVFHLPDNPR